MSALVRRILKEKLGVETRDEFLAAVDIGPPWRATMPPPGFSEASRLTWDNLPDCVRDDISKGEAETNIRFERYRGVGKFAKEAERNGTTLEAAINSYAEVESALRNDFLDGIELLCSRLGIKPQSLLFGLAQRYSHNA